ncbi:MAG: hypothetical protein QOF92_1958, partial [Pseudonocardiales bacterium]|nr:hypothetical protein [Pseudonocardiales bacterium]MDT4929091.1 hypothetical protein [Pseudonocardiales bacterium]
MESLAKSVVGWGRTIAILPQADAAAEQSQDNGVPSPLPGQTTTEAVAR